MGRGLRWWGLAGAVALALIMAGRISAQDGPLTFDENGQTLDNQYGFL